MYGQPIVLNAKGQTSINSLCGAICSIFTYAFALAYAVFRFQIMCTYNDNSIMQNNVENFYGSDD